MSYCTKCGGELGPDDRYCPECGEQVIGFAPSGVPKPRQQSKIMVVIVGMLVLALVALIIVVQTGGRKNALVGRWEGEDGEVTQFSKDGTILFSDGEKARYEVVNDSLLNIYYPHEEVDYALDRDSLTYDDETYTRLSGTSGSLVGRWDCGYWEMEFFKDGKMLDGDLEMRYEPLSDSVMRLYLVWKEVSYSLDKDILTIGDSVFRRVR